MGLSQETETLLSYKCYEYGDHDRQRIGAWHRNIPQNDGRWVVFIHGGAWRDPRISFLDFLPSIKQMTTSPDITQSEIYGFASIDYNLSPHPELPQDPAEVPVHKFRGAKHPDHILDIRAALKCLQSQIQLKDGYVLIGHSAGATLAYQIVMGQAALAKQQITNEIPLPAAIVGIAGIYDLIGLESRNSHVEAYYSFISGAFGSERADWVSASPGRYEGSLGKIWSGYSLLAYSPEDTLIDSLEIETMAEKLNADGLEFDVVADLFGEHDAVWQEGSQIARLVAQVLQRIQHT